MNLPPGYQILLAKGGESECWKDAQQIAMLVTSLPTISPLLNPYSKTT